MDPNNNNNALAFKVPDGLGTEYTNIFSDLNFNQDKFKFTGLPNCAETKQVITVTSNHVSSDFAALQKEFDNREPLFVNECNVMRNRAENFDTKRKGLVEEIFNNEMKERSGAIEAEDAEDEFAKHDELFDESYKTLEKLGAEISKQLTGDGVRQAMSSLIKEFDLHHSRLASIEEEKRRQQTIITDRSNETQATQKAAKDLEEVISIIEKRSECLNGFGKIAKEEFDDVKYLFELALSDFSDFKTQIGQALKIYQEEFGESQALLEKEGVKLEEHEKVVADLKHKKATLVDLLLQNTKKMENVYAQKMSEEYEFEKKDEDYKKSIEDLHRRNLELQNELAEKKEKNKEEEAKLQELEIILTQLREEEANLGKAHDAACSRIQALDEEEAILEKRLTEIKINLEVEKFFNQQYDENVRAHEKNVVKLQSENEELQKILDELLEYNKEK